MSAAVSERSPDISPLTDACVKVAGAAVAINGLVCLVGAFGGDHHWIATLWFLGLGLFQIPAGIGLMFWKSWAFLVFSMILLVRFLVTFITMLVAFQRGGGEAGWPQAILLGVIIVLIGSFGRWSMERRFRPHLDVD